MRLKTIEEHNIEKLNSYKTTEKTGIECPICKNELVYSSLGNTLLTMPPQKKVQCSNKECNFISTVFV